MTKKVRITKANQIAVNNIRATKREMNICIEKKAFWKKKGEQEYIDIYQNSYDTNLTIWNAQIDMFAEMMGLTFMELISDDNYRKMQDIADANLD